MRNAEDVTNVENALLQFADKKPNVVIVGSSFIGMEAASILAKVSNVTVIGMEQYPFERVLGTKVGEAMFKLNQHNGIGMEMKQFVEKYDPAPSDPSRVGAVVLKSGKSIPADFVILGAGVIPKTDFLKSSGIPIDKDQGISVTASMEVPNFEGVYAIGDIARYPYHLTGENVRVEHWSVAQNQGRTAAETILAKLNGQPLPVFKSIPYFWTVQYGKSIRYVGHATSFDDAIVQGSVSLDETGGGLAFVVFYTRNDKVVAVCSLAKDPVVSHASELLRIGKMPTATELRNGKDIMTIPLKCKRAGI
ncbi:hypothetical protein HDU91_004863 [Kappamyces sp. JEL0680]|nr:hypothetical protein HDU91_004863 [Kappamyces sp. JEL0680]